MDGLARFVADARTAWGPLSTELVDTCRAGLRTLAAASPSEPWLSALLRERPANRELHRDGVHGFVLLAHAETGGLYRPPHDHGGSWVAYAVVQGEMEMGSYGRTIGPAGELRLVRRDTAVLGPGQVQVYLPEDIHDTRCVSRSALLLRFTERDLKADGGRAVTRFADAGGFWTAPTRR